MIAITSFEASFTQEFPDSARLLAASNFRVHECVERISLHGSRGPAQRARRDSDFDLCLHVGVDPNTPSNELDPLFREVLDTTLLNWRGSVEADLAVVYALHPGGLAWFEHRDYDPMIVPETAVGQFALFKTQKWFDGFVDSEELLLEKMYPCVIIWRRAMGE